MTTLILRKNRDGTITGRCDARCYNAKGLKCKCVCGGINHGVGYNQAINNTHKPGPIFDDPEDASKFIIRPAQYKLFPEQKT